MVGAFALTALFVGASAVGFGIIPATSAQALAGPVPLPTNPASLLAALEGPGGLTSVQATALAGSGDVMATGAATMVNPAGAALGTAALGFSVGSLGVNLYSQVTGQTAQLNSAVCSAGQLMGTLYGQNCAAYLAAQPNALTPTQQNTDVTAGTTWGSTCDANGSCWTITKVVAFSTTNNIICFSQTAGTTVPASLYVTNTDGTTAASAMGTGWNSYVGCGGTNPQSYPDSTHTPKSFALVLNPPTTGSTAPARATTSTANPQRNLVTTVTGSDGKSYSCTSQPFTETDATLPGICVPVVPSGVRPNSVEVDETSPGAPAKPVVKATTTTAYNGLVANQPDCTTGKCHLQVYVNGNPCSIGSAVCQDWLNQYKKTPADYACEYGPASNPTEYSLAMSECNTLGPYYRPLNQQQGNPYGDPTTGLPGDPASSSPSTSTAPSSSGSDCFGQAYGTFDPAGWVLAPVKCALQWAFVPTDAKTDMQKLQTSWNSTPGAKVAAAVAGWNFVGPGTGCGGVVASLAFIQKVDPKAPSQVAIGAACPGDPLAPWAGWANLFLTVVIVVSSSLALIRIVAGIVAYDGGAVGGD